MKNQNHHNSNQGLGFGLLIITIGVGLLLRSMDIFPSQVERVLFHWPMLLVLGGLYQLLQRENRFTGLILLAIGLFFTLPRIEGFPLEFRQFFWPSLLILAGILILTKHKKIESLPFQKGIQTSSDENFIVDTNIFGGSEKIITAKKLKGGKLTSVFGGSELNFLQAELGPEPAVFELFFLFGGSSMEIPADWTIHIDVVNIFGGFSQKQVRPVQENPEKIVYIKGMVIFGGGEIKRF